MTEKKDLVNWYGENQVRSSIDENGNVWFVAKDVCDALELSNSRMVLERLDEDEKGVSSIYTPGGNQQMALVNESGLYNIILRSDKPEAKKFRKWITSEVLPEIRQTGKYYIKKQEMYSRIELLREIEKLSFRSMTDSLKLYGEAERTHGHAYSLYANLIYKLVLGKTAKQIKEENGLKQTDSCKDYIEKDKLVIIDGCERFVDAMLKLGHDYDNIKFNLEKLLQKKDKLLTTNNR